MALTCTVVPRMSSKIASHAKPDRTKLCIAHGCPSSSEVENESANTHRDPHHPEQRGWHAEGNHRRRDYEDPPEDVEHSMLYKRGTIQRWCQGRPISRKLHGRSPFHAPATGITFRHLKDDKLYIPYAMPLSRSSGKMFACSSRAAPSVGARSCAKREGGRVSTPQMPLTPIPPQAYLGNPRLGRHDVARKVHADASKAHAEEQRRRRHLCSM
eukprot:scaffold133_cov257-Pinguiococcus_pyrenoidosus.AAC.12